MKNTLTRSVTDETGTIWFVQKGGARQRARIGKCITCNEDFATYPHGRFTYCSPECVRKKCERCGGEYHPTSNRQRFCSDACKFFRSHTCEECGEAFHPSKNAEGRFCSSECFYENRVPTGSSIPFGNGYTMTKVPKGTPGVKAYGASKKRWMMTHRWVMQEHLGRPLMRHEEVHHINGKRDDNRIENLELWKLKSQPAGVRIADYHCPGCRCHEQGFECT